MSDSWRDLYKGHIQRHRFQILDGRVALGEEVPIRDGNYADVYTGSLKSLEAGSPPEKVAVKMIRGQSIDDSHIRKFFKEVHTWSKLDNSHILPLRGITLDVQQTLSIISPWMVNGSAKKYVSSGDVDPRPLLHDVASGLHYLHTREEQVYHGDLKGDNVMISDGGRALLADFGFSVLASSSFSLPITHPTGGTRAWMAPEKWAEKRDSAAADVYSFAMLTVELFTRKLNPFHEEPTPPPEAIQNGKRPQRPTPDMTLKRLTDDWWKICELGWDSDPSKRPTAKEILESITQPKFKATHLLTSDVQAAGGSQNEGGMKHPIKLTFILVGQPSKAQASSLYVPRLHHANLPQQIVLTVTPAETLSDNSVPIAWKIFAFDGDTVEKTLSWTGDFGFSTIGQQEDGTIVPDHAIVIPIGQMSRLVSVAGKLGWSSPENGSNRNQVAVSNQAVIPATLALVTVDDAHTYSPVVHLGRLQPGDTVLSGMPVKLQAYAVSGSKAYKEGQVIKKQELSFPLFTNFEGISEPHDLQYLRKDVKFSVSSHPSGRFILKLTGG